MICNTSLEWIIAFNEYEIQPSLNQHRNRSCTCEAFNEVALCSAPWHIYMLSSIENKWRDEIEMEGVMWQCSLKLKRLCNETREYFWLAVFSMKIIIPFYLSLYTAEGIFVDGQSILCQLWCCGMWNSCVWGTSLLSRGQEAKRHESHKQQYFATPRRQHEHWNDLSSMPIMIENLSSGQQHDPIWSAYEASVVRSAALAFDSFPTISPHDHQEPP
jgi:hypothetical protein